MTDYSELTPQPIILDSEVSALLPEQARFTLQRIGLPMDASLERDLEFSFEPYEGQFRPIVFENNSYIPIGKYNQLWDNYQTVALQANTGHVYILISFDELPSESSASPEVFVNSSLETFLKFCKAYLQYSKTITNLAERKLAPFPSLSDEETVGIRKAVQSEINNILTQLEKEFASIDPDAIDNVYTFWGELLFGWRDT